MLYSPWISSALSWKFIVFNPSTISYQLHTVKNKNSHKAIMIEIVRDIVQWRKYFVGILQQIPTWLQQLSYYPLPPQNSLKKI